jgi:hypothetical protein
MLLKAYILFFLCVCTCLCQPMSDVTLALRPLTISLVIFTALTASSSLLARRELCCLLQAWDPNSGAFSCSYDRVIGKGSGSEGPPAIFQSPFFLSNGIVCSPHFTDHDKQSNLPRCLRIIIHGWFHFFCILLHSQLMHLRKQQGKKKNSLLKHENIFQMMPVSLSRGQLHWAKNK